MITHLKLLVLFLLLSKSVVLGQTSLELGGFVGLTNYYGDVAADLGSLQEIGRAFGLSGRYMVNRKFGIKWQAGKMEIRGADQTSGIHVQRGWKSKNSLLEISSQFEYHFLGKGKKNIAGQFNKNQFTPYLFWGLGCAFGKAEVSTRELHNSLFPEEKPSTAFMIAPFGAGFRFDLSKHFLFSLEIGKRAVFSDYLDGISVNGNSSTNDSYLFAGIILQKLIFADVDVRY